jgi:hypothetical protein
MTKTYVIPSMAECVVVQRAACSEFKDVEGRHPKPPIRHNFTRNGNGCAQFTTDDAKVQEFLEQRPMYVAGTMIILNAAGPQPVNEDNKPKVKQGIATSAPVEAPEAPEVNKPGRKAAKVAIK